MLLQPPVAGSLREERASAAITDRRLASTLRSTGVTRPPSVATAIDTSTDAGATSPSSLQ